MTAKQLVVEESNLGTDLFFVLRGHLRVVVVGGGRETILRDFHDGEYFGELAALDGLPRSASIFAITNCFLACMPASTFREALHAHPDVCNQVLATLTRQVRGLANRVNETAGLAVKHRLIAELLRLARPSKIVTGTYTISPPPTHAELADRVATHREAVTREMGALKRASFITYHRSAITLLRPEALRAQVDEAVRG